MKLLNHGSDNLTNPKAITPAINEHKKDSLKNWAINCLRIAPTTFLNPISFDRFNDLAVERLIKLQQAIRRIRMAAAENIYT